MWYFLDKRGRPIEWFEGRRLSNFVRFLLYCRDITTERPNCMYPCWMCENCRYAEPDEFREIKDCPKCKAGIMYHVKKRYKPLTEGTRKGGRKDPPIRPRPNVKVPAQVAKPDKQSEDKARKELINELRAQQAHMGKILKAMLDAVQDLRRKHDALAKEMDRIKDGYANARNEISRRVDCTCLEQGDSLTGPHLWTCPLGILCRTFDELMVPGSSTPGAELPKFRNKTGKEKR